MAGVRFESECERARFLAPLRLLDEQHLAVRTRNAYAGQFDDQGFRWHLVGRDGKLIRERTAGLTRCEDKQAFKAPGAVHDAALLMLADGQLWRLPVRGEPQSLTTTLAEEVEAWCAPFAPWRMAHPSCDALRSDSVIPPIDDVAMRKGRLALRLMRDDVFTGEFAFLDLASEAITRLKRPTAKSVPLEASALANAVVFQRKGTDGDEVLLVRDGAGPTRSEEHTSELQSLMRISYAVFCLKKKKSK